MPDLPPQVKSLMSAIAMPQDEDNLSDQEINILAYIAGYIVRKIRSNLCIDCSKKIVRLSGSCENDLHYQFIRIKNIENAKEGLLHPSTLLLDFVCKLEEEYRKLIDSLIYNDHVKACIVNTLLKNVSVDELQCSTCKSHEIIVSVMVNIRLHHSLREANHSLRDQKDRRNRKTLKFCHM